MRIKFLSKQVLMASAALGLAIAALLAERPSHAQAAAQPEYHPSLADLMTLGVQPRHIKLAAGGRARNWAYVAYEADELRNALNRVGRTVPIYRNTDMAMMLAANMKEPLDQMDAAIKAKDGARFDKTYAAVTHACNTCHEGLGHPFVVIRVPVGAGPFADQSFAAQGKAGR